MNLPPELLEHILLFLSDEPWVFPTLACVSRAWCYPAQSRLYAHVKVTKRVWRKLCQSLQRAPHLRELVRSLEFCVDPWPATRDLPISFAHLFPRLLSVKFGPNTLNGTAFDQLVEAAPGLRSLRLAVSGTAWTDVCALLHTHNSWDRLSISLKRYTGWPYDDSSDWTFAKLSVRYLELMEDYNPHCELVSLKLLRNIQLEDSTCLNLVFNGGTFYYPPDFSLPFSAPVPLAVSTQLQGVKVHLQEFRMVDESGLRRLFELASRSGTLEVTQAHVRPLSSEQIFGEAAFLHEGEWTASTEEIEEGEPYGF